MESKGKKHIVEDKTIVNSVKNAVNGVTDAYNSEYQMVIHGYFAIAVIVAGALFQISYTEWLICFLLIGLMFVVELINTAIESMVNLVTVKEDIRAKRVKDIAGGAVLVMSATSIIVGLLIFLPKFFELF